MIGLSARFFPFSLFAPNTSIVSGATLNSFSAYTAAGLVNLSQPVAKEFQDSLRPEYAIDNYVLSLAKTAGKRVGNIEEPNALIDSFRSITDEEWRQYLVGTLYIRSCESCFINFIRDFSKSYSPNDNYGYVYETLKNAYRDRPEVFSIYEKFFFTKRNSMLVDNIITKAINQKRCDVVVIGGGHFGGEKGIVSQLRKKGFVVNSLH